MLELDQRRDQLREARLGNVKIKSLELFGVEKPTRGIRLTDERANIGAAVERGQICGEVVDRASRCSNDRPVADESAKYRRLVAVPDNFRKLRGIAFLNAGQRRRLRTARRFRQGLTAGPRQFEPCVLACACATN
jgi:hypothetical protein